MIRLLLALVLSTSSLAAQQLLPDTLRGHPGDTLVVRVILPPAGTYQLRFVRPAGTILSRTYVFDTVLPVVATTPGPVTLRVTGTSTTGLTVAWTAPTDGTGKAANVALRFAAGPLTWSTSTATEIAVPGTTLGATQSFLLPGLSSGTTYQVQAISYRGTLNVNAVFGPLSNVVTGTTGTIVVLPPPPPPPPTAAILFQEPFEDNAFATRGWYDNTALLTTTAQHATGSTRALELHWLPGGTMPTSGGSARHLFPATSTLDVRYWVKYSANWVGSGKTYHPHEFLILSDQDGDWDGPSNNWLTAYIEHVYQGGGIPRFAIQDNKAINTTLGALPLNLVSTTETRSVAGCNGVVETNVITTCFNMPPWYNDKEFHAAAPVPQWRDTWNQVEAYLQLNTVVGGIGQADGVLQYWFNGALVIDRHDVQFRTGARPTIQFHQFLIGPYIGDGSPVDQTMWVDNLTVATSRGVDTVVVVPPPPPPPSTGLWPNEPAGWTTMTDFAFDNYTSGGWHTNPGPTIIADPTAPVSPPNVAQWFYPAGFGAGSSPGTVYFPATMKDHYVGYTFKYSNPYSNQVVGTKQWYPASSSGSNYFMLFASDSKLWMYVQADGAHGSSYNLNGNVSNPTITLGVWHKLEILQRYPSSSAATDGVFRWWIDGVLCGNYPNVTWNVSSVYDEVRFVPVWGGIGGAVGFNSFWWVDHIHLSRP